MMARNNFVSTDLCSGRFLYEQAVTVPKFFKKSNLFASNKVDICGNILELSTMFDDAWYFLVNNIYKEQKKAKEVV